MHLQQRCERSRSEELTDAEIRPIAVLTGVADTRGTLGPLRVSSPDQMDQTSNRSGVGSDDVTDEPMSLVDARWSSEEEEESSDPQGTCLGPQPSLPTYKNRCDEFKKLFKEVPDSERLLLDYPCALQRDILLQGRLYLTEHWLCFYSNVFWGTKIAMSLKDINNMTREKTARLIPNAIQICINTERFFFTSFSAREKSYIAFFRIWQNALLEKPLTCSEFWQMVKQHYGSDLGLSHEEMEGLQFSSETTMQSSLTAKPGGEDSQGQLERTPSLRLERTSSPRLPAAETGPVEASTPQSEEVSSPLGSQGSSNVQEESHSVQSQQQSLTASFDRSAAERGSKRSSLSVDLNCNNNASEQSGSETTEEVEKRVGPLQVQGRVYLNKVFHISAGKMFDLLFTESTFIRRFMDVRKITNASFAAWEKDAAGNDKRSLNYKITISNPLIGKFSNVTENQTLFKESRDGQYYHVDAEVYTHDVPYHDYFYTQNRYHIIRTSKRKCRLRVHTDVKYKKQPWGLIKSFITKNSWSGIEDYFRQLESELLEEEAEMNQGGADYGKMGGLRRRRRTYSQTLVEHMKPSKQYGQDSEQLRDGNIGSSENVPRRFSISAIVFGMSVILLILTLLNLGLFFKLWAMEDIAQRMYVSTKTRLRERSEDSMRSEYGPRQGQGCQTKEDQRLLKSVLQDSINLLEQLRSSLILLQQNFALANETTAPK